MATRADSDRRLGEQTNGQFKANDMYDVLLKNLDVVRPNVEAVETLDIAIKDGKFARIAHRFP